MRPDKRANNELRKIEILPSYLRNPQGSCLVSFGNTKVICSAFIEEKVPAFLTNSKKGWITAEYSLLPASTVSRTPRESSKGKIGGRTHEIQRLIGRSLRAIVDLTKIGENTIWLDCVVIEADGGTRTAAITGSYVALYEAIKKQYNNVEKIIKGQIAAVSVGISKGEVILDLNYAEDSNAEVDMNIIMTDAEQFIEIQGTAEQNTFSQDELQKMLELAKKGIKQLFSHQQKVLEKI
jgi:ribonuclease PH